MDFIGTSKVFFFFSHEVREFYEKLTQFALIREIRG